MGKWLIFLFKIKNKITLLIKFKMIRKFVICKFNRVENIKIGQYKIHLIRLIFKIKFKKIKLFCKLRIILKKLMILANLIIRFQIISHV